MKNQNSDKLLADEQDVIHLLQNLERQIKLLEKSEEICLRQRRALVNNNLEENIEINKEQDHMALSLEKEEKERIRLMKKIIQVSLGSRSKLKVNPAEVKCETLYPLMTDALAGRLLKLKNILTKKIEAIRRINEINYVLVQNSRNIIQATLTIITGISGREEKKKSRTYGAAGKINQFTKQKVRLFNRKA